MATSHVFTKLALSLGTKKADLTADTVKAVLLSALTVGSLQDTAQYVIDIMQSKATAWAATTAYALNDLHNPGNGHYYKVTSAGTSAGTVPTWPTGSGATVTDGSVTWTEQGASIATESTTAGGYTLGGVGIGSSTFTESGHVYAMKPAASTTIGTGTNAAYVVFVDTTPGTNATNPVLAYWDLGGTVSVTSLVYDATNGLLTITGS